MANQQGALTALHDPKATCDPATEEIVDIEFDILDVESQIVEVDSTLAAIVNMASFCGYHVPQDSRLLLRFGFPSSRSLLRFGSS